MADPNAVAKQFTDFYYGTFDRNRVELGPLYRDISILSWEGPQYVGAQTIIEKLSTLPFKVVQHKVVTLDAQLSSPTIGSIIVMVTGLLTIDGENTLQFSQVFHLIPEGQSYWVYNDVFRLNYGL